MWTYFQGETFRLVMRLKDASGAPSPLAGVTAEGRMEVNGAPVSYPAVIDAAQGELIITVDRDLTAAWDRGRKAMRVWLDYGEGAAVEARMIYEHHLEVRASL